MNEGWICPSCKRGVAPTEKHCDHGAVSAPGLMFYRYVNPTTEAPLGCACPLGHVCGNAACPRLPKITCGDLPSTMSG